jgi:hypothetical protein
MTDSYQAVFDAVRSRFSSFDGCRLIDEISAKFDISHAIQNAQEMIRGSISEYERPSTLMRPKIAIDGNQWCALYGENLQDGVAGFGNTPEEAMRDFDKNWVEELPDVKRLGGER